MIPWETIKPVFVGLFGELAGDLQTVWIDKRRPLIDPKKQAALFLHVRNEQGIGIDDRRYRDTKEAKPAYPFRESANGHRRVRLEVRVESFRHDDDRFAYYAASKIRTRLGWRSSLDRLRAVNVAVIAKGDTVDLSGIIQDDRVTSIALFELVLNVGVSDEDTTKIPAIETVEDPQGTFN